MAYNSATRTFDTIADLRGQAGGINGAKVSVLGYLAAGDCRQRVYRWVSSSTLADDGGVIIKPTNSVTGRWKMELDDTIHVEDYGAVPDANYVNGSGDCFVNSGLTIPSTDSTVAIQNAITAGLLYHKDISFQMGFYQVTNTLNIDGTINPDPFTPTITIRGNGTGGYAFLRFKNSEVDKVLLNIGVGVSFLFFEKIGFIDIIPGTSKAIVLKSTVTTPSPALWKTRVDNFRMINFKIGIHFLGDPANPLNDAVCSENLFQHGKVNNCRTAVLFENTQAVNTHFIAVDFENSGTDDETNLYKIFHFKRGSYVNHIGGSAIGSGPYVYMEMLSANQFAETSKFNSDKVRVEKRVTTTPLIHHAENSVVTLSNVMQVTITDMSIVNTYTGSNDIIFAKIGGCIRLNCSRVRPFRRMYVYAAITANLVGSGNFGGVSMIDCQNIEYKKYLPPTNEYGSAAVGATSNAEIPFYLENRTEQRTNTIADGEGYLSLNYYDKSILPTALSTTKQKRFVYQASDYVNGLGGGANPANLFVKFPAGSRLQKLCIFKQPSIKSTPFIITLIVTVSGIDYTAGTIDTTGRSGYMECLLAMPVSSLDRLYVDGTIWDGKTTIQKTGNVSGFLGLIYVDYI